MLRYLMLFVLLSSVFWGIYRLVRIIQYFLSLSSPASPRQPSSLPHEKLAQCAKCQLFVPESQAIYKEGNYYCSQEHSSS
ncbi:MAG: PP0621 family protein [Candidatus Berkiellales bacterium]